MIAPYPHRYVVEAAAEADGQPVVTSTGLAPLTIAPPAEFGGPGDQWSPENMLVAAVASCFALTFRAVATASKLNWRRLHCSAEGVLDRDDGVVRFTALTLQVELALPDAADSGRAERLLEKAEKNCLVTNSLRIQPALQSKIVTA